MANCQYLMNNCHLIIWLINKKFYNYKNNRVDKKSTPLLYAIYRILFVFKEISEVESCEVVFWSFGTSNKLVRTVLF